MFRFDDEPDREEVDEHVVVSRLSTLSSSYLTIELLCSIAMVRASWVVKERFLTFDSSNRSSARTSIQWPRTRSTTHDCTRRHWQEVQARQSDADSLQRSV